MTDLVMPTEKMVQNCASMGWEYLGDGLFGKGDVIGWFTSEGFQKK